MHQDVSLELPVGSKVAVPVLTCSSVVEAIFANGLLPVLCEIRKDNLTIDEHTIPGDVQAIVVPHAYGAAANTAGIGKMGLPWIEDCATSPATTITGLPAGKSGTLAVFSFASTKFITGGLGGLVVFDRDVLATKISTEISESNWPPIVGNDINQGRFIGRLCDINSTVALAQLRKIDDFLRARKAIAKTYRSVLEDVPGISLISDSEGHSYYRFICRTDSSSSGIADALRDAGVDARVSVNPWLDQEYRGRVVLSQPTFPGADCWRNHLLSLPIYPTLSIEQSRQIGERLKSIVTTKGLS
jgi:perosamine synthetase